MNISMQHKALRFVCGFVVVLFLLTLFVSASSAQLLEEKVPFKIVQLGDSYSAGNGARSASGDRNYYSVSGCYRSPTNWGSQFAESLKDTFAVTYINRACSGGVVRDILNERDMRDTAFKDLFGNCPTAEYPDEEYYRDTSLLSCTRYINPQIDAIDSSVDLVLLTMGGNDLGFDTIIEQCFALGYRDPEGCRNAVNEANAGLADLQSNMINAFAAIKAKLKPGAKIAYVAYPQLTLPDVEYTLTKDVHGEIVDSYDAGTAIRNLGVTGEAYQKTAVEAANAAAGENYIVFYDGTKALFSGHEPNPSPYERNPNRWIHEFEGFLRINEWYHPNELGHENWGRALSAFETFGAAGGVFEANSDIDVALVVDTTGSMAGEIAQVQADLSILVNQLAATTDSYRIAVVSYRDFPERTGWSGDYPARVDQTFTNDLASIQAGIDSLSANGGGDWEETVFSGIQAAIKLPWRPGVTKIMIVIGDAPALSPEPISNLTAPQIVASSIAIDPVKIIGADVGNLNYNGAVGEIAGETGGSVVPSISGLTDTILEILDQAAKQPFAWLGQAYSGTTGQSIEFDASGSYDPSGFPIMLYEWDFDNNGIYDLETTEATAVHVYDAAYDDYVVLRVTGSGGTTLASSRTLVNAEGFAPQGGEDACELDESGFSIITDENGDFINCTPESLPDMDQEGVSEIVGNPLDYALADLENAINGLSPIAFENQFLVIWKDIESDDEASACDILQGMSGLANAQAGKKITQEQAAAVLEAVGALKDILGCTK
ncbi:MAG: hypothetical protein JW740_01535 [Candidatus Zambryskibacteria bacterium]|nr:hypothetical protein [Candidatus Zambryskibacteria bacterium]